MKHQKHGASAKGGAGELPIALRPTRPQLTAVAIASVIALTAGLLWSAYTTNLKLGAPSSPGSW